MLYVIILYYWIHDGQLHENANCIPEWCLSDLIWLGVSKLFSLNLPFTEMAGINILLGSNHQSDPISHESWYFLKVGAMKCPHVPLHIQTWQGEILKFCSTRFPFECPLKLIFPLRSPWSSEIEIISVYFPLIHYILIVEEKKISIIS